MTPHELNIGLGIMMDDIAEADKLLLNQPDSQFSRRMYIRSSFSNLEGAMRLFKDFTLNVIVNRNLQLLSTGEYIMLTERSYEIDNKGDVDEKEKFIKLNHNFRFTFGILKRVFNSNLILDYGASGWNNFLAAKKIRDRLTHPKKLEDLTITDTEIDLSKKATLWIIDVEVSAMQGIFEWDKVKNSATNT